MKPIRRLLLLNRRIEIFIGTLHIGRRTCLFVFHRSVRVDSLPRNLCPTLDDAIAHCIPHIHACTRFIAHKHRNRRLLSFPCRGTSRIQLHADAPPTRLDRVDYRKLLSHRLGRWSRLNFPRRILDAFPSSKIRFEGNRDSFHLIRRLPYLPVSYSHRRRSSSTLPSRIVHPYAPHTRPIRASYARGYIFK